MAVLLPMLVFVVVFAGALLLLRRSQRAVTQLARHQIVAVAPATATAGRVPILGRTRNAGAIGRLTAKAAGRDMKTKASKLLLQAGSPMPLGTYLLLRAVCAFVLTPLFVLSTLRSEGLSLMGIMSVGIGVLALPNAPLLYVRRKARQRTRMIEQAMPDALDLLVVCVEGGLSLDGALQQVSQRMDGTLSTELRRLQSELAAGLSRRDALIALGQRSQSQSLSTFCATIVQADKMGMSIAQTLRTLAETLRTRRRQEAETQARKAPIKMLPFLVFFMLPSLFVVILGPAALAIYQFFHHAT